MDDKRDRKGLLNEILPDPKQAENDLRRGSPRERTTLHLRQILAAAAGIAFVPGGAARGDTTPPAPKPNSKGKHNDESGKPIASKKPPIKSVAKPPEPIPPYRERAYMVVDPVPEPYRQPTGKPGFVDLASNVPASIIVDGDDTGLTTPQKKMELQPGVHVIELVTTNPVHREAFTVTIRSGQTIIENHALTLPKPAPMKTPEKK